MEYEPTTKVLSVVNSVEMEGVEKYLVVSGVFVPWRSFVSWSVLPIRTASTFGSKNEPVSVVKLLRCCR